MKIKIIVTLKKSVLDPQASNTELEDSVFDMVIAGNLNEKGEVDIVMVEAGASDNAFEKIDAGSKAPSEELVADGIDSSKQFISELIAAQAELVSKNDVPVTDWPLVEDFSKELKSDIEDSYKSEVENITSITDRKERSNKQSELEEQVVEKYINEEEDNTKAIKLAFKSLVKNVVRDRVISGGERLDGRSPTDIREISAEIGLLPTVHGSSLFLRGETQVLNVTTLGMGRLEQMLDTIDTVTFKDIAETHQNKPKETINEAKLWNYFNEVSNVLSDLRMKGWLRKAEKQNPELKRDLKKVEKAASQLMIWLDDIADSLE